MNPIARQMTMAHIKVTGFARSTFDRMRNDDRGQGTLEYVGITIAVIALVLLIAGVLKGSVGTDIKQAFENAVKSITGGGGDPAPATTP